MGYKIAIASTDGIHADAHFGSTKSFFIIEVNDDGSYTNKEERIIPKLVEEILESQIEGSYKEFNKNDECRSSGPKSSGCGSKKGCGNNGGGCGGHSDSKIEVRVSLISDCRCLICKNIGPSAERQLERKAITAFQIDDYKIEDALIKIIGYYTKVDKHISLRRNNS